MMHDVHVGIRIMVLLSVSRQSVTIMRQELQCANKDRRGETRQQAQMDGNTNQPGKESTVNMQK